MKSSKKSSFLLNRMFVAVAVVAGLAFLSGCETTGTGSANQSADSVFDSLRTGGASGGSKKADVVIKKGMSKAEVVAILGEPSSVEDVSKEGASAEIWIYQKSRVVGSTIESDGEQERVYADPETGALVTVREPIYRNEKVMAQIKTQLLFNENELVAFKEEVVDGILAVGGR